MLDTGVLILLLRSPRRRIILKGLLRLGRAWLSSVALGELYAGAVTREDREAIVRFIEGADLGELVATPTHADWVRAGHLIALRSRLHGAVRPRDHLNDLLILLSAQAIGARVLTTNVRHFADWAQLAGVPAADVVPFPAQL